MKYLPSPGRPSSRLLWFSTGLAVVVAFAGIVSSAAAQPPPLQILVNHVGYDVRASKKFVVQAPSEITVSELPGGRSRRGGWRSRASWATGASWARSTTGSAGVSCAAISPPSTSPAPTTSGSPAGRQPGAVASRSRWRPRLLPETLLFDLLFFLKSQRSSGIFDQTDRSRALHGQKAACRPTCTAAGSTPPVTSAST